MKSKIGVLAAAMSILFGIAIFVCGALWLIYSFQAIQFSVCRDAYAFPILAMLFSMVFILPPVAWIQSH